MHRGRGVTRRGRLLLGWIVALLAAALFARLGLWQTGRALQKEAMQAEAAQVLASRRALPLDAAADPQRVHALDWAAGSGHFIDRPLLLDNQQREGRVGMRLYAPFRTHTGTLLLVDLGWLPVAGDRALPRAAIPGGPQALRGLLAPPPSAGLSVGAPMAPQGNAWLMVRLEPTAIAAALDLPAPLAPRVLRLDPKLPLGHVRDLELLANTLSPEKHRGYALQWFGLALTTLVIALVLTFRRSRP